MFISSLRAEITAKKEDECFRRNSKKSGEETKQEGSLNRLFQLCEGSRIGRIGLLESSLTTVENFPLLSQIKFYRWKERENQGQSMSAEKNGDTRKVINQGDREEGKKGA